MINLDDETIVSLLYLFFFFGSNCSIINCTDKIADLGFILPPFRNLTAREQKLRSRRRHAEELLSWKKRLDEEEARVSQLEKEALHVWDGESGKKEKGKTKKTETEASTEKNLKGPETVKMAAKDGGHLGSTSSRSEEMESLIEKKGPNVREASMSKEPPSQLSDLSRQHHHSGGSESSIAEELPSRSQSKAYVRSGSESSVQEDIVSKIESVSTDKKHHRSGSESSVPEDIVSKVESVSTDKKHHRSGSESSITEDIPTQSRASSSILEEIRTVTEQEKKR